MGTLAKLVRGAVITDTVASVRTIRVEPAILEPPGNGLCSFTTLLTFPWGGFRDHKLVRSRCVDQRIRSGSDHLLRSAGLFGGARGAVEARRSRGPGWRVRHRAATPKAPLTWEGRPRRQPVTALTALCGNAALSPPCPGSFAGRCAQTKTARRMFRQRRSADSTNSRSGRCGNLRNSAPYMTVGRSCGRSCRTASVSIQARPFEVALGSGV